MVLHAKELPCDYSHYLIRMSRFADEGMSETLDSKQIQGNAFQLLEEAEEFNSS